MPRPSNDPPNELEIFLDAPAGEADRKAYLDCACGVDATLRARVEALFAAERNDSGVMDRRPLPTSGFAATGSVDPSEAAGTVIANYRLAEEIGRGGFGVVYRAEQLRPVERQVALKIIKLGMDTRQVVARFEAERQALAMMDHPAIAKVHDAGATEGGRPYFVMELVDGIPITDFCESHQLDLRGRLELFMEVCRAVQHAHLKGIIHRDLKPSNILVAMHDGRACPKVIDFGVAKATEQDLGGQTIHTREEQVIGTPAYMSPEQAQQGGIDIDSRSDVYSLGVLLYELLTGTTPFDGKELARAGQDRLKQIIQEVDPPRPSSRTRSRSTATGPGDPAPSAQEPPPFPAKTLRGELDWIVMKALEKDRGRRYETANSLAEDIQRFLNQEPVRAAAPSVRYRVSKYIRRHRAGLAVAAALAILLVTGSLVSLWQAQQAMAARDDATTAKEKAARGEWVARHQVIEKLLGSDQTGQALADLAQMLREDPNDRVAAHRVLSAITQRELPNQLLPPLRAGNAGYFRAEYSPDGSVIATGDWGGSVQIWDARTGQPMGSPMAIPGLVTIYELVFSPDGNLLASLHERGLVVWEWRTGTPRIVLDVDDPYFATFSPDSRLLLTRRSYPHEPWIIRVDESDRETDVRLQKPNKDPENKLGLLATDGRFTSDGRRCVVSYRDGSVYLWDLERALAGNPSPVGKPFQHGHQNTVWSIDLSGNDQRLVTTTQDGAAHVWEMPSVDAPPEEAPRELMRTPRHEERMIYAEFSPDPAGGRFVAACSDGTATVWEVSPQKLVAELKGSDSPLWRARFDPEGERIVTASNDGTARVWEARTGRPLGEPLRHEGAVERASFHPDGSAVLTVGAEGIAKVWESRSSNPRSLVFRHRHYPISLYIPDLVRCADFSPDGRFLITAGAERLGRLWDLHRAGPVTTLPHLPNISSAGFSPDGSFVLTTSNDVDGGARLWRVDSLAKSAPSPPHYEQYAKKRTRCAAISPDSQWIATGLDDGRAMVWKVGITAEPSTTFDHKTRVTKVRFDPRAPANAHRIVTGCTDGVVKIWKATKDGHDQEPIVLAGHEEQISEILFSKDGRRLATASFDGTARVWNPDTGKQEWFRKIPSPVLSIDLSPDGSLLAIAGADGIARIWELETSTPRGIPLRHERAINMIRFAPHADDPRVVTASSDWTARVWDLNSGLPLSEPLRHRGVCLVAQFSPDAKQVVTTGQDRTARVWDAPRLEFPVPDWLPDWAEEAVGFSLEVDGTTTSLPWDDRLRIRASGATQTGNDPYARAIRWFYTPTSERSVSAFRDFSPEE